MKFNKKMALISAAVLMGISTVSAVEIPQTNIVQAATSQSRKVYFRKNSYVYNKKGQRIYKFKGKTAYFKKGSTPSFPIQTTDEKTHYYFNTRDGKVYLQTTKIKGKQYANVGNGGYINLSNIGAISNSLLLTDQNVRVRVTRDTRVLNSKGQAGDTVVKKGTIITVDGHGAIPGGDWIDDGVPQEYYHIVGTDHYLEDDNGTLLSQVQNGNTFDKLFTPQAMPKNAEVGSATNGTSYYDVDGKDMFPGFKSFHYQTFTIGGAYYLWNAKDNKAELFYYVGSGANQINLTTDGGNIGKDSKRTPTGALFVKASDVNLTQGVAPEPANTAAEAEAGRNAATSSEKSSLTDAIANAEKVQASAKYKSAASSVKKDYDQAVAQTKQISASTSSTGNAVNFAIWQLNHIEQSMQVEKIKVAYPNFLSPYDRTKILTAARQQYDDNSHDVMWANHDRDLILYTFKEKASNKYDQGGTVTKLNLNDYIEANTPNIKNKKGYDSSATQASINKDKKLAKYAQMLDYDKRKSSLVAKRTTPVYQSSTKIGEGASFNVNKIRLYQTGRSIKKGNNIGIFATLIVKIKGQYYFMVQEKNTYFVKASDVKLDNFSTSTTYKKYQRMVDKLTGPDHPMDFSLYAKVKKGARYYQTDFYYGVTNKTFNVQKNRYVSFIDPYVMKYNGIYYLTGGAEFNSDFDPEGAVKVSDIISMTSKLPR